jgi:hypothetical protein
MPLFDEGLGGRFSYEEEPEFEPVEEVEIIREEPEEKVEAVFSIRSKNNNGQPGSQTIKHKHQFYAAMADDLTHGKSSDLFLSRLCR